MYDTLGSSGGLWNVGWCLGQINGIHTEYILSVWMHQADGLWNIVDWCCWIRRSINKYLMRVGLG